MFFCLLMLMIVLCSTVHVGSGGTYFVKPNINNPSTTCPSQPCYSLEYYLQNASEVFTQSNVTLKFLPGIHLLDCDQPVQIKNVENFTIFGARIWNANADSWKNPIPSSEIMCQGTVGFRIVLSRNISIQNLIFTKCGAILTYKGNSSYKAALLMENVTDVTISRIVVQNSSGYGMFATNILGESILSQSTFMFNKGEPNYYGGNVRINYYDCPQKMNKSVLIVNSSRFVHGYDPHMHYDHQSTGSGLTVFIGVKCSEVVIFIDNITASDNEAQDGGNMALLHRSDNITNSVHLSNSWIMNGRARSAGGGINIWTDSACRFWTPGEQECDPKGIMNIHKVFNLTNVTFVNNKANQSGGVMVGHMKLRVVCFSRTVTFQNIVFLESQSRYPGHAVAVFVYKNPLNFLASDLSPQFETIFINCSFTNSAPSSNSDPELTSSGSAVYLVNAARTIFNNCTFKNTVGSAILASGSNLIFRGNSFFTNNSAANGGALSLNSQTLLVLQNDTHIYFIKNCAKYAGGAIYSSEEGCFLYFEKNRNTSLLIFQNNTANYAGTAMFFCYRCSSL